MPTPSLPRSLADLLAAFGPCFTAPTMRTFQALVGGFLAQPGLRTVTGMLVGTRLAGRRHHDLAYRFFSAARWSAGQVGLVLLDLIAAMLVPPDAAVVLAVDDTLWRRTGRKLHGVAWHHDGAGPGRHRPAWGHRWVVVGIIVHRPFLFGLCCLSLVICWYARHGQPTHDLAAHRARAPWYRHKRAVSVADMLAALRRALLAAQYRDGHPDQHTLDLFPNALLTGLEPAA